MLDRFSVVTEDPNIDKIKLDGSILYINFICPQTLQEYRGIAEMNTWQFSEFKLQKLDISHVSIFITYKGKVVPGSFKS